MNRDTLIRASTAVAVTSMLLLLYWVFAFGCVTVFGLKVFRENITQAFGLSILGILALLAGSLIVNIIFNLSKIADSLANDRSQAAIPMPTWISPKAGFLIVMAVFPAIAGFLFIGDWATTKKKERHLVENAQAAMSKHSKGIEALTEYSFSQAYLAKTHDLLLILSRANESSPQVALIVEDTSNDGPLILAFHGYRWSHADNKEPKRTDYIYSCSAEETEYLHRVFSGKERGHRFSASDGSYELYFPIVGRNRSVVLYFSDRQPYGKLGS